MFKIWLNCYIDLFNVFSAPPNVLVNFATYTDGYILPDIQYRSIKLHDNGQTVTKHGPWDILFHQIELCGQHNGVASHGADAPNYRNQPIGLSGSAWTGQGMTVTKYTYILTT